MKLIALLTLTLLVSCGKNSAIDCFDGCLSGGGTSQTKIEIQVADTKATLVETSSGVKLLLEHYTNDKAPEPSTLRYELEELSMLKCGEYPAEPKWAEGNCKPGDVFSQGVGNFLTASGTLVKINIDRDARYVRVQEVLSAADVSCPERKANKPYKPCFDNGYVVFTSETVTNY